jgi:predicted HTH transcriptional regulator
MKLNTSTQQSIILKHLQANGTMTTLEARNLLFIMHPAARVQELRAQGKNILTVRVDRIAKYVLSAEVLL